VLGVVLAAPGALLDLAARLANGLSHLLGHDRSQPIDASAQRRGHTSHAGGSLLEAAPAPGREGRFGRRQLPLDDAGIVRRHLPHQLARGRIDRSQWRPPALSS
jgi:hypothetical protein